MPNYRRLRVPGATYFFTVNLSQRGGSILTDHIDRLRDAYRLTVAEHPVEKISSAARKSSTDSVTSCTVSPAARSRPMTR